MIVQVFDGLRHLPDITFHHLIRNHRFPFLVLLDLPLLAENRPVSVGVLIEIKFKYFLLLKFPWLCCLLFCFLVEWFEFRLDAFKEVLKHLEIFGLGRLLDFARIWQVGEREAGVDGLIHQGGSALDGLVFLFCTHELGIHRLCHRLLGPIVSDRINRGGKALILEEVWKRLLNWPAGRKNAIIY